MACLATCVHPNPNHNPNRERLHFCGRRRLPPDLEELSAVLLKSTVDRELVGSSRRRRPSSTSSSPHSLMHVQMSHVAWSACLCVGHSGEQKRLHRSRRRLRSWLTWVQGTMY